MCVHSSTINVSHSRLPLVAVGLPPFPLSDIRYSWNDDDDDPEELEGEEERLVCLSELPAGVVSGSKWT